MSENQQESRRAGRPHESRDRPPGETDEEQLKALEAELERITVDDVILQTIVSLVNLGARKGAVGAPPDVKGDREQLRQAIEAVRALVALVEPRHGDKLGPIRDALSQLQIHYARSASGAPPEEKPSAVKSGRLWVPGQ
jgi:hypothetical protein